MDILSYTIAQRIRKPREAVFAAIVDPRIFVTYFPLEASGPLEEGAAVQWKWGKESAEFFVTDLTPLQRIEGHWEAWKVAYHVQTTFEFLAEGDSTVVRITERGFHND